MTKLFEIPIKFQSYIEVPIQKVFEALTSARIWDQWFTTGMTLEPYPGGRIHFRWRNWGPDRVSQEDTGQVIEIVPNKRFSFNWHPAGKLHPTIVAFVLEPLGTGTVIRLHESGYPDTPEGHTALVGCATGWGEALVLLKFYLESGMKYRQPGDLSVARKTSGNSIQWKLHFRSSPEKVFEVLVSAKGRENFWAEKSSHSGNEINFEFSNGYVWQGQILANERPHLFRLTYMGSEVTFSISSDGNGGSDLILKDTGTSDEYFSEVRAGWLSVLLAMKAYVDFGIDLRNHDPKRTWDHGYVDN